LQPEPDDAVLKNKKMPFKQFLPVLGAVFFLSACNNHPAAPLGYVVEKYLMANWELVEIQDAKISRFKTSPQFGGGDDDMALLREGLLISFFPDHQCAITHAESGYTSATWSYDAGLMALILKKQSGTDTLAMKIDERQAIPRLIFYSGRSEFIFRVFSELAPNYTEDPFFPEHNRWRMPADTLETNEQLVARLDNYFGHLARVLKSAIDHKQEAVSFQFSKGIVKIYNGGIGIVPLEKVPVNWILGFYDIDQAKAAYNLYQNYLRNSSHEGESTGKWFTDDYNLLVSVQSDIKAGRFLHSGTK
jgi:hypothetical protein